MNMNLVHKQLSLSGYPFQLRVEEEIRSTFRQHGWDLVNREQAWFNSENGKSGFIDILLQHADFFAYRMIIECKRNKSQDEQALQWIFPIPKEEDKDEGKFKLLKVEFRHGFVADDKFKAIVRWDEPYIQPATCQAQFCSLVGDDPKRQPILETLCSELLHSVEGLADEEMRIAQDPDGQSTRLGYYVPVIVTNSQLKICKLNVIDIPIDGGAFEEKAYEVKTVPFLRFRKSLTVKYPTQEPISSLKKLNKARERSVFIVNSEHITEFLTGFSIQ